MPVVSVLTLPRWPQMELRTGVSSSAASDPSPVSAATACAQLEPRCRGSTEAKWENQTSLSFIANLAVVAEPWRTATHLHVPTSAVSRAASSSRDIWSTTQFPHPRPTRDRRRRVNAGTDAWFGGHLGEKGLVFANLENPQASLTPTGHHFTHRFMSNVIHSIFPRLGCPSLYQVCLIGRLQE